MKKILLSVSAALFFSCSDLSLSDEEALESGLPTGFSWRVYAEINKDVKASQVLLKIQEENKGLAASEVASNCTAVLSDLAFAAELYMDFANCPKKGWSISKECPGVYANNTDYSVLKEDGTWTCNIGSCWSGGWDDPCQFGEPGCVEPDPVVDLLQENLETYAATGRTAFAPINIMCMFVSPQAKGSAQTAKTYLNTELSDSKIDSLLIKKHYFLLGQSEGRPYKYCEQGKIGAQKNREQHAVKKNGGSGQNYRSFYDYGSHLFCLNKDDEKVYVVK